MKIVDRAEFLTLPVGTVYAKVGDASGSNCQHYFGEVRIKDEARGENDWWSVGFTDNFIGAHDSGAWSERLDEAYAGGEAEFEFETLDSDGLYDDNQRFAIFSDDEHRALIERLQAALEQKRAGKTTA